jgi:hypothetical protein
MRPLKAFLCHAHADRNPVRTLDGRAAQHDFRWEYRDHTRLTNDGVDAWLDKAKPCGERSAALSLSKCRTILPGQGLDTASPVNLPDWELEIRKA